ncbi:MULTISPECIES: DUF4054 domain-containing protein [Providencia]|uniref:DUF4054 domain-containing protein n=1 Tax=Providencia TaxID=586 RepID=UPI0032DADA70
MDKHIFPIDQFRILRPQFNALLKDDVLIIAESALHYFPPSSDACFNELWMLVVAHMLDLNQRITEGMAPTGVITNVTMDKVSISFTSPPSGSDWSYWFKMTTYGQQFLALFLRCELTQHADSKASSELRSVENGA